MQELHKVMRDLCKRKVGTLTPGNDNWYYRRGMGLEVEYYCWMCGSPIVKSTIIFTSQLDEALKKHAILHLKEYNLLAFL